MRYLDNQEAHEYALFSWAILRRDEKAIKLMISKMVIYLANKDWSLNGVGDLKRIFLTTGKHTGNGIMSTQ